jgi:hypothetical protein
MFDAERGPGLAAEAFPRLGRAQASAADHLQRDGPVDALAALAREPDRAHPAAAERSEQLVVAEAVAVDRGRFPEQPAVQREVSAQVGGERRVFGAEALDRPVLLALVEFEDLGEEGLDPGGGAHLLILAVHRRRHGLRR